MTAGLVLRDVDVDGRRVEVRIESGRVSAIGRDLVASRRDDVAELDGGAVLPGLHDHHIHLLATAAALGSVTVGPPDVGDPTSFAAALRDADAQLPAGAWLRAVGYHESVAGSLDRWALDALVPARPLRVQHRSGALWILNSAALHAAHVPDALDVQGVESVEGVERDGVGEPTGRLWRLDAWLRARVPSRPLDLTAVGATLLRAGVTAVTDATPTEDSAEVELIADAVAAGALPQRVVLTGGPALDPTAAPLLDRGPVKLLLADHDLPSLDQLVADLRLARSQGRAVALHCVTRLTLALALAALQEAGPRPDDRIEHGAAVGLDVAAQLAAMDVTVVTNPGFVAERGDQYLADVEPSDLPDLWRCRSLLDHGVGVGAGTDAPFGRPDPWAAIAAAVDRRTAQGQLLGATEALPPARALDLFLTPLEQPGGAPRRVTPGAPADLCILRTPLAQALTDPGAVEVAAVVVDGRLHTW